MDKNIRIVLQFQDQATGALASATSVISGAFSGLQKVTATATSFLQTAWTKAGNVVTGVFNTMFGGANKWASFFVGAAFLGIGNSLIEMAGKFERFGKAAEFMTGSREEADKFAQSVRNLSKETMFNVDQIAEMESRLVGNTRNVALSDKTLRALTEAVAATGGSYSELEGVTRAWIQTNSKGKASAEEMNRQFTNANIPVNRLLAESIVKDINHPLRQYLEIAGSAGGASKTLTTAYKKASDGLGEMSDKLAIAKQRLKEAEANTKTKESTLMSYRNTVQNAEQQISKANSTIGQYTEAQKSAGKATKATTITVEQVMSQLQEIGDLNIPGSIAAEAITRALNEAYGGANQELIKTFDGQMSLLKDMVKLTALSFIGLDKNFRVVKGGFLDALKNGLEPLIKFLNDHERDIIKFAENFHKSIPAMMVLAGIITGIFVPALIGLIAPILLQATLWGSLGFAIAKVVEKLGGFNVVADRVKDLAIKIGDSFQKLGKFINQNKDVIVGALSAIAYVLGVILLHQLALVTVATAAFVTNFLLISAPVIAFIAILVTLGGILGWIRGHFDELRQSGSLAGIAIAGIGVALLTIIPLFKLLTILFMANPFGFVVTAVAALTLAFIALYTQTDILKTKTDLVKLSEDNLRAANDSLKLSTDALKDAQDRLTGANLNLEGANLRVERSQRMYEEAVIQYGPTSLEAREAELNLKQARNDLETATDNVKDAVNEKREAEQKLVDATAEVESAEKSREEAVNREETAWGRLRNTVGDYINKLKEAISLGSSGAFKGATGSLRPFQHGGIVPGPVGQPIPIMAHGGERITPRGSNREAPFGGGGGGVTINMNGQIVMDTPERVNQLAEAVIRILGRQNELARFGVGFTFV